jgi:hypothetical protein
MGDFVYVRRVYISKMEWLWGRLIRSLVIEKPPAKHYSRRPLDIQ